MKLQRNDLLQKFNVVDVDAAVDGLPHQVTHVPSIMTQVNRGLVVLQDAQLVKFVDALLGGSFAKAINAPSPTFEVEPCVGGKCSYAYLDGYETLDTPDDTYSSFAHDTADAGLLLSPGELKASQESSKMREGDGALDQLVSARNADIVALSKH